MYLRARIAPQDMIDQDFIVVQGHDLQDVLLRIGMSNSMSIFLRLLVRLNPLASCEDPDFLAEVWGVEHIGHKSSMRCLYMSKKPGRIQPSVR